MSRHRPAFDLILVSGLILFLELACIRWFPAHVLFLSFFTNTVLLACFVGMSVGCMIARKPTRHLRYTPFWLAAALAAGLLVETYHQKLERHLDVGHQANPDVVFFGAEVSSVSPVEFAVPVEVMVGAFYFLVAVVMVGPGQELGRAFNRIPRRSTAYTLNLLGSLAGILLFAGCSELSLPPAVWFAVVAAGMGYLLLQREDSPSDVTASVGRTGLRPAFAALVAVVALAVVTSGWLNRSGIAVWSPYYRVQMNESDSIINTNMISHQVMKSRESTAAAAYSLPYLFARDTGRVPYQRILVIGAGSGNDLSRALYWSPPDARIDAVEIDPVIRGIGAARHPDQPYADPRVTVHLTDGRTFLRTAPAGTYDLVIFALVDSLVLHAGAGNIRLESYLFTQEAFADVARVLKPEGTAAVYNYFRHGWIVARLRDALRDAFGADPVVLTDPPVERVALDGFDSAFTAVFAGRPTAIAPLRDQFAQSGNSYWVPGHRPVFKDTPCRFGPDAPPALPPMPVKAGEDAPKADWVRLRSANVDPSDAGLPPATDEWPFLYVRRPAIPAATWNAVGLVALLSLVVWVLYRDRSAKNVETPGAATADESGTAAGDRGLLVRSFWLGAGFMLIETRAVVEMALLFGSTWVVNTVVFAAVLLMALAGNQFAAWRKPRTLWPYYAGLFIAVAVGVCVPSGAFLGWPRSAQMVASCLLAFAPVAFAGVIFAASFERSRSADRMFGANVAGALVGGLAENASLLVGFRWLLLAAAGFYLISSLFGGRSRVLSGPDTGYNGSEAWSGRVPAGRFGNRVRNWLGTPDQPASPAPVPTHDATAAS
ncbi:hypothetical protein [Fimbriiglobus ruber]|uniref:Spermidine synthase n=1 Tax=Fimbriiglobus ruber TaxID=1908690 RepID=A0A225DLQ6_9BACT|nr:hypothetical protein [Fimbriiglobus ruber]OWK42312.1 hypothetical protein FRUB_04390 [Fimbriiglobus ruber]